MKIGEGASKVVTAVANDAELRERLITATEPERREILQDAGLLDGLTDQDYADLRRLNTDATALNEHLLESVTGGDTATSLGAVMQDGTPSISNAGGATLAGEAIEAGSAAVVSTGMGAAAVGVVVGGAAFGF